MLHHFIWKWWCFVNKLLVDDTKKRKVCRGQRIKIKIQQDYLVIIFFPSFRRWFRLLDLFLCLSIYVKSFAHNWSRLVDDFDACAVAWTAKEESQGKSYAFRTNEIASWSANNTRAVWMFPPACRKSKNQSNRCVSVSCTLRKLLRIKRWPQFTCNKLSQSDSFWIKRVH